MKTSSPAQNTQIVPSSKSSTARAFALFAAALAIATASSKSHAHQGRLESLVKEENSEANKREKIRKTRFVGGFGGAGNGGAGGDFVDTRNWMFTLPAMGKPGWSRVNWSAVSQIASVNFTECAGSDPRQPKRVASLPTGWSETFVLNDEKGAPLRAETVCADAKLFEIHNEFVFGLWAMNLAGAPQAKAFVADARKLNGKPIELRLTTKARRVAILAKPVLEPTWYSVKERAIYVGPRNVPENVMAMISQRSYEALLLHELGHLWTSHLLREKGGGEVETWHDFSSASRGFSKRRSAVFHLSWSSNPYAIETGELTALLETFSNTIERLAAPARVDHPFVNWDASFKVYKYADERAYIRADERLRLPAEKLVKNEAYMTTILHQFVERLYGNKKQIAEGYVEPQNHFSPVFTGADPVVLGDLIDSMREVLTESRGRTEPLFFQWLSLYDQRLAAQGDRSLPGMHAIREYFFVEPSTGASLLPLFELSRDDKAKLLLKRESDYDLFWSSLAAKINAETRRKSWMALARNTSVEKLRKIHAGVTEQVSKNIARAEAGLAGIKLLASAKRAALGALAQKKGLTVAAADMMDERTCDTADLETVGGTLERALKGVFESPSLGEIKSGLRELELIGRKLSSSPSDIDIRVEAIKTTNERYDNSGAFTACGIETVKRALEKL